MRAMSGDWHRRLLRALSALDLAPSRRPPFLRRAYAYRPDRRLPAELGPELTRPVAWRAEAGDPAPEGDLTRLFYETPAVHKWRHYLPIYERLFEPLRRRPLRFLEIGVSRGGSLAMWRR